MVVVWTLSDAGWYIPLEGGGERTWLSEFCALLPSLLLSLLLLQLQPADEVVGQMLSHLTSQEPGYQYFTAEPGSYSLSLSLSLQTKIFSSS